MSELDIQYIGEWLLPGNFGHFCALLSMVAALFSTVSYFFASQTESSDLGASNSWKKLARTGFAIHGLSVLSIIVVLFLIILEHRFEYKYVWQHSSVDLPVYYMISCFWEGQEGSFLLWTFWHVILGAVLIRRAGKWENRTMTFVCFTQIFLAAMLIGLYFFDYKIGSSPFVLMRDDMPGTPIFMRPNYLEFIPDGTGLNPLLQNYWMVIHPPTLFLGFAATIVPFAYVMAALWKRDFTDWVLPTLKWSLFAAGVLGTGVLMGGAWAYEALSFGGFWAWDPVENASLVPWIVLIAGIHTLLSYKHSGHALKVTTILLSLSFMLILYSTFLTRSGILGDTSVHSFTDLGMSGQLLSFLLSFAAINIFFIAYGWKAMPSPKKEESAYSREFWLFVSALIMTLLAALITIDTSWPVINKILGTDTVIVEPVAHYNRYAVWFAVTLGILSSVVQFLRYKNSSISKFLQRISISAVIALLLTGLVAYFMEIYAIAYVFMLFSSWYVIVANFQYMLQVLRGKISIAGASVAHIGFGLILLGVLISAGKQEVISLNTLGIDYGEEFSDENKRENVLLYKGRPIQMGEYWVTYLEDSVAKPNTYYKVRYEKKRLESDTPTEQFTLYPNAQVNPNMGLIANPDTRHYYSKDVFTHVSSVSRPVEPGEEEQSLTEIELAKGDTAVIGGNYIYLESINPRPSNPRYFAMPDDIAASAVLKVVDGTNTIHQVEPVYYIRGNSENQVDSEIEALGMSFSFAEILTETSKVKLKVVQKKKPLDFIIMKAIVFPYINVLWLGCLVMVIGFVLSVLYRNKESKRIKKSNSRKDSQNLDSDPVAGASNAV